jgi:hypothetical protein
MPFILLTGEPGVQSVILSKANDLATLKMVYWQIPRIARDANYRSKTTTYTPSYFSSPSKRRRQDLVRQPRPQAGW